MINGISDGGESDTLINKIGGASGIAKLLSGEWIVGEPATVLSPAPAGAPKMLAGLLESSGEPLDALAPDRFVARDAFVIGSGGEVPISYLGEDFTDHFLGLVEDQAGAATLRPRTLVKASIDTPIFAALGGEKTARIALAHFFEFLKKADRTRWFFAYVADTTGKLWAIDTYWRDGGWDMEAYSVTYPRGWRGGGCIVSR